MYFRMLVCLGREAKSKTSFVELRPERRPWDRAQNAVGKVSADRLTPLSRDPCVVLFPLDSF